MAKITCFWYNMCMLTVPNHFQFLFPSSQVNQLETARDKTYIIDTLLKNATMPAWKWMMQTYSSQEISSVIKITKTLKKKDVMIWSSYLDIPPESILCLQTKFPAGLKSSWAY